MTFPLHHINICSLKALFLFSCASFQLCYMTRLVVWIKIAIMNWLTSCFSHLPYGRYLYAHSPTAKDGIHVQSTTIVATLLEAEKPGQALKRRLDDVVAASGWTEHIAEAVLNNLVQAIRACQHAGTAMTEALEKSTAAAVDFAHEHPLYATVIALGVLVVLAPWVIEALGFGELGPVQGGYHSSTFLAIINHSSRLSCRRMASEICRLRSAGIFVFILPKARDDVALLISTLASALQMLNEWMGAALSTPMARALKTCDHAIISWKRIWITYLPKIVLLEGGQPYPISPSIRHLAI